jgi:hypothetical protein
MDDQPAEQLDATEPENDSPLPMEVECVSAYAWQRGAAETILFHSAGQLTTAAGPLELETGTWLLVRWDGLTLGDTLGGELVCVLPE